MKEWQLDLTVTWKSYMEKIHSCYFLKLEGFYFAEPQLTCPTAETNTDGDTGAFHVTDFDIKEGSMLDKNKPRSLHRFSLATSVQGAHLQQTLGKGRG